MINKQVNHDLKNVGNWLRAKKISLTIGKGKRMLFTSPKKQLDSHLKIKLNGRRLYETGSVNYLGIQIDKNLKWKQQVNHVVIKLNQTNAMLFRLRHLLDKKKSKVSLLCST